MASFPAMRILLSIKRRLEAKPGRVQFAQTLNAANELNAENVGGFEGGGAIRQIARFRLFKNEDESSVRPKCK